MNSDIKLKNGIFFHDTAEISDKAIIGDGTKIWNNAQIREGARIGNNCTIGKDVYIDRNVRIGNNVKIQNGAQIFDGVTIEDDVFIGPGVIFSNDLYPRAFRKPEMWVKTVVRKGASVCANSTIICGITLGKFCMVGAGSVVTRDVDDNALVYGNPARKYGVVDTDGRRYD